ncbi:MAG: glycoside hydrolase family 65 protein [Candidatus Omnitrophica bacterium]|nr:glycoside hydrolase family 65 protein [Candidatus Omnitrophota bacterium]
MKDFYSEYNSDDSWLIKSEGWVRNLQGVRESQLALGNGFLGSRGILEEIPYDCSPGTFVSGIYDKIGSQVPELVNFPNPFNFKITANGEKVGVIAMDVLQHKRLLNMRHGLLSRHTLYSDSKKRRYDYQSIRFVSMADKNIGVMQIVLTSLDDDAKITIQTGIDASVHNAGVVTEGRKKHFRIKELDQFDNEGYLAVTTFEKKYFILYRSGFYYRTKSKEVFAEDNIFELKLKKNQTAVFTKLFYIDYALGNDDFSKVKEASEKRFRKHFRSNFNSLIRDHINAWEKLWNIANVSIWGRPEIENNFRFNLYHMLICAGDNNGFSSIGAKTLSGEGYRGHIFWDTEIFLLPFYIYTSPNIAKSLLLYRYNRLDKAREIAKESGYKGVMFPWESADTGEETTPTWAKDLDGRIIKINTNKLEHHITADIAFAYYHYYIATGDEEFMKRYGYEVLFETARFWASRVEYNKKKHKYEIKHVIGPDEFHDDIDNNAYTNIMAKWNLIVAYKMFNKIKNEDKKTYSNLIRKINLDTREVNGWKRIAPRICLNMRKDKVIEQFDRFFKKRVIKINEFDENFMPLFPKGIKLKDYGKTQLIKQADVIMLLYLLSDVFNLSTKKINYFYYIDRTVHKSSLSPSIHAIMALEAGDLSMAYQYFNVSLHTDIADIHDNTKNGIHAACLGGTWQIVINGFAGVRIEKEILSVNPNIPKKLRKILFSLKWRGNVIKFEITNIKVRLIIVPDKEKNYVSKKRKKAKLKIKIFQTLHELEFNKKYEFAKKVSKLQIQQYY